MKFSVIVPTYHDWPRLRYCLQALEKQTMEEDQFEIIIVDNSEKKDLPENLNLSNRIRLVHEPKPGSYAARNRGAEFARGEIFAFTDSDCIPDKYWLTSAADKFRYSACDLIGGNIQIFPAEDRSEYAYIYDNHTAFPQYTNIPRGRGVTANLFVKEAVFRKVGGFNSAIKSGGDWDFTLRCTKRGYRMIYCEDVLVLHPSRNLGAIFRKHYRLTCWGSINGKNKYGHSQIRILCSHLLHGLSTVRKHQLGDLHKNERIIIFSIDILKYLYRAFILGGILLRLIKPDKVRE